MDKWLQTWLWWAFMPLILAKEITNTILYSIFCFFDSLMLDFFCMCDACNIVIGFYILSSEKFNLLLSFVQLHISSIFIPKVHDKQNLKSDMNLSCILTTILKGHSAYISKNTFLDLPPSFWWFMISRNCFTGLVKSIRPH